MDMIASFYQFPFQAISDPRHEELRQFGISANRIWNLSFSSPVQTVPGLRSHHPAPTKAGLSRLGHLQLGQDD